MPGKITDIFSPMRKTYKPIARAERTAQVYRKKTLAVTDDLNIKQDPDKMENVDEYWSTAASVIGNETIELIDDTMASAQSDTLFNLNTIRQSVKASAPKNQKRLTLKFDDKDVPVMTVPEDSTRIEELESNTVETSDAIVSSTNVIGLPKPADYVNTVKKEDAPNAKYKLVNTPRNTPFQDEHFREETAPSVFDVSDVINTSGTESETKENRTPEDNKQMARNRRIFKIRKPVSPKRMAPAKKVIKKPDAQVLEIMSANERAVNNKVKAMVCTDEIDTAVMSLNYLAYVNNETADKTFSLFVVKGSVELSVEESKTIMRKGEATVVSEGCKYSINSISKQGSLLFLSYVL